MYLLPLLTHAVHSKGHSGLFNTQNSLLSVFSVKVVRFHKISWHPAEILIIQN